MHKIKKKKSIPKPLPKMLKSAFLRFDDTPEGLVSYTIKYSDNLGDQNSLAHVICSRAHSIVKQFMDSVFDTKTDDPSKGGDPITSETEAGMDRGSKILQLPSKLAH